MKLRLEGAIDDSSGDVRHQLQAADKEVDRLSGIVDDLLATSREREVAPGAGGSQAQSSAVADLGQAVARTLHRWETRAATSGCTLTSSGIDAVAAVAPGDLDQILDNLVENAILHAPGPIDIATGRHEGRVTVVVSDHGPGIRAEEVAMVTDRFFRGHGAKPGGSGLGLAIVRELADRWDGKVSIRSALGTGTSIEVELPSARGLIGR